MCGWVGVRVYRWKAQIWQWIIPFDQLDLKKSIFVLVQRVMVGLYIHITEGVRSSMWFILFSQFLGKMSVLIDWKIPSNAYSLYLKWIFIIGLYTVYKERAGGGCPIVNMTHIIMNGTMNPQLGMLSMVKNTYNFSLSLGHHLISTSFRYNNSFRIFGSWYCTSNVMASHWILWFSHVLPMRWVGLATFNCAPHEFHFSCKRHPGWYKRNMKIIFNPALNVIYGTHPNPIFMCHTCDYMISHWIEIETHFLQAKLKMMSVTGNILIGTVIVLHITTYVTWWGKSQRKCLCYHMPCGKEEREELFSIKHKLCEAVIIMSWECPWIQFICGFFHSAQFNSLKGTPL